MTGPVHPAYGSVPPRREEEPAKARKTPMVQRNLRVSRDVWDAAAIKGSHEDPPRGVSDVVRDLLAGYVAGP